MKRPWEQVMFLGLLEDKKHRQAISFLEKHYKGIDYKEALPKIVQEGNKEMIRFALSKVPNKEGREEILKEAFESIIKDKNIDSLQTILENDRNVEGSITKKIIATKWIEGISLLFRMGVKIPSLVGEGITDKDTLSIIERYTGKQGKIEASLKHAQWHRRPIQTPNLEFKLHALEDGEFTIVGEHEGGGEVGRAELYTLEYVEWGDDAADELRDDWATVLYVGAIELDSLIDGSPEGEEIVRDFIRYIYAIWDESMNIELNPLLKEKFVIEGSGGTVDPVIKRMSQRVEVIIPPGEYAKHFLYTDETPFKTNHNLKGTITGRVYGDPDRKVIVKVEEDIRKSPMEIIVPEAVLEYPEIDAEIKRISNKK